MGLIVWQWKHRQKKCGYLNICSFWEFVTMYRRFCRRWTHFYCRHFSRGYQPLGLPLGCGGPYLGYMAATDKLMRKLPGRIVGETTDDQGRRAYVLSLQAREQHIRREKASSNICSNEALCALTAGLYMATMGPDGMAEAAEQSMAKAHYLEKALCALPGVEPVYGGAYFHEFVLKMPRSQELLEALDRRGILGGLPLGEDRVLWCATEKVSRRELDEAVSIVKEVLDK